MDSINFNTTRLTQALVKCKSVTPVDDGALEIVEKHLSSIGFKCTPLLFSDPNSYDVKNLFASIHVQVTILTMLLNCPYFAIGAIVYQPEGSTTYRFKRFDVCRFSELDTFGFAGFLF